MNIALHNSEYLNFVEFNITGDNDNFRRCDLESRYLDTEIFNLFQTCFENAGKTFDYFGGTRYNSRTIIVLRNELKKNLDVWSNTNTLQDFHKLINSHFMGKAFIEALGSSDHEWQDRWKSYYQDIIKVLQDLIELTEKCAFEERILWVIGY